MPAYLIFIREQTLDPAALATYDAEVGAALAGHEMALLAKGGALQVLEGGPIDDAVVVQFATAAKARAFYDSDAYQAVAVHRRAGGAFRGFITEGLG